MSVFLYEITSKGRIRFRPDNSSLTVAELDADLCHIQINMGKPWDGFYFFNAQNYASAPGLRTITPSYSYGDWYVKGTPFVDWYEDNLTVYHNGVKELFADEVVGNLMAQPPLLPENIVLRLGLWDGSLWSVRKDGTMTTNATMKPVNNAIKLVPPHEKPKA